MSNDGADLENVLNEAALVAARRNKSVIDASDIDEAEDRVIAGLDPALVEDGRSIVDLTRGEDVPGWREDIVCEFHGHHFPLQQRMLRTKEFKLVISPESINELYDLRVDPSEMNNVYTVPVYDDIRRELATNLYLQLRERGDHSFAKWMAAMTDFDIPLVNTARSDLDEVMGK